MTDQPPATSTPPPGWYPDPNGQIRWWDGQAWGAPAPANTPSPNTPSNTVPANTVPAGVTPTGVAPPDARSMAMLSHLLAIFTGFLGPLVIYLMNGRKDPFVRHHASEALNFQITYTIALFVSILAVFLLVGLLALPVVIIGALVFEIQGTIAANRGEWWRYPVNLRLVPGLNGQ